MKEKLLREYKSRRNCACLIQTDGGQFVQKTFSTEEAFEKELQIYRLLQNTGLPCAKVIETTTQSLVLSQLPGKTLVECLDDQEQRNLPVWEVWGKLVGWLVDFQKHTGYVMTDVNLRNFLYDETKNILYGLDFEECSIGSMCICAARTAAFIRTYTPENTLLKQAISQYVLERFASCCGIETEALTQESKRQEAKILEQRKNRI